MAAVTSTLSTADVQKRTRWVLSSAQVFSSLGNGSTLALGSVLAVDLSGNEALAGTATTALGLGAALSAVPLARLAAAKGRRIALGSGLIAAICGTFAMVAAVIWSSFALLVVGSVLVGVATAVNLQARFAVTDLAEPEHRGRDLSIVVWAITVGAVLGPNTVTPGAAIAQVLGLPPYAGAFLISAAGMVVGGVVILTLLRPDPLLTRRALDGAPTATGSTHSWAGGARIVASHPVSLAAVVGMIGAHATMVGVMSMTPLHIAHRMHDAPQADTLSVIGVTISLHIAGMYALSPVMGVLTDRLGPKTVTVGGLVALLGAVALAGLGAPHLMLVTAGLVLLGLGWSASSVAGATMLTSSLPPAQRVEAQGFTDALVSLVGAIGAATAGLVMGAAGYPGVGLAYGLVSGVAAIVVLALTPRSRSLSPEAAA
ncbi:MFS transporter [Mobilicoccus massiliensis]|uniref:MFS transporter n=1 Tax=Mobilicoccus massiliensis TaxID=1522310 RepID=UPI000A71320F|nr:MFS transporter [Mobilicoccus massiliensis]